MKVFLLILAVISAVASQQDMYHLVSYGTRQPGDILLAHLIETSEEFPEVTDATLQFDYDSNGGQLTYVYMSKPADMDFWYRSISMGWRPSNEFRNRFESTAKLYNSTKYELHAQIYGFRHRPISSPVNPL